MLGNQMTPEELQAMQGQIISKSYKAGYVVLSYFISCVGAFTTLEILKRRTASQGWYNRSLALAASISMGGISTWCMHFIGDCALIFGEGQPEIQISTSSGLTALSFFIPVIIQLTALWVAGSNETSIPRAVLGGVLAGLGACGMHYLGQYSILNYDCIFNVGYVIGATALAIVANVVALIAFFMIRAAWHTSWWKRALCAVILATGVSGMHWLIATGTSYQLKEGWDADLSDNFSQSTTVTVVIILACTLLFSIICCITLIYLTLLEHGRMSRAARKAEQVVLAAAIFDKQGRICVTHEGFLPRRKIANSWFERSMDDIFNIAHPVFLWIFRASRNWSSVSHLIPGMKNHLFRSGIKARLGSLDDATLFNESGTPIRDYSIVFRELFCVAAAELAADLNRPMKKLGVIYDEVVITGLGTKSLDNGKKSVATMASSTIDLERDGKDSGLLGKGQLLFLVSRAGRYETGSLEAAGFRFAQLSSVQGIIAKSLRVEPRSLARRLDIMRTYYTDHHILEPGVHLGCFGIRASLAVGRRGFDILVRRDAKNQLPTMQAPFDSLEPWHIKYLEAMDSKTVSAVGKQLYRDSKPSNKNGRERRLARDLLKTLESLKEEIEDPLFNDSMLVSQPFNIPCRGKDSHSPPGLASLIAFRIILPLHSRAPGRKLAFTPMTLFKTQQRVYDNSPDHAFFARSIYEDFVPLLDIVRSDTPAIFDSENSKTRTPSHRGSTATRNSRHEVAMGEHIDMYGNQLPEQFIEPYRGPSKVRFWDRPRGENSSDKFLTEPEQLVFSNVGDSLLSPTGLLIPAVPAVFPTPVSTPAMELQSIDLTEEKPCLPSNPRKDPNEETTLYIDALFALTVAKRKV